MVKEAGKKQRTASKVVDQRQLQFIKLYFTPGTKFFNNALQSAMKAGYTQNYAESILSKDLKWLAEGLAEIVGKDRGMKELVTKARRVLDKSLDSENETIAQDTAKFIAKNADKDFNKNKDETTVNVVVPIFGGKSGESLKG